MFKKDLDLIHQLHEKYHFQAPLLDAGGLPNPSIADYDISAKKAYSITLPDGRTVKVPHGEQGDRYLPITNPWDFIDPSYTILNPAMGNPLIEDLPEQYNDKYATIIVVSVFEHVDNPYKVSDALYRVLKPGGYLINSTPFIFPYHPSPEDNWRFSPTALKRIHESSGFKWLEGDFHITINTGDGVGDFNPDRYAQPQAIWASYALCRK